MRKVVLAAGSGLIGTLAFPPFGYWSLAIVSVAGFSLAISGQRARRGAVLGAIFGAGLFLPMLHWSATYVGAVPWLILVMSQAAYLSLLAAVLATVQSRRFGSVVVAACWVIEEAVRGRVPFGGFPWGRWAFSQADSPMKWFAAIGGAPLVTFMVALAGALLAAAVTDRKPSRRTRRLGGAVLVCVAGGVLSLPLHSPPVTATTTVAAIQGNVPDRGLEFNARRRQVLDNHVAETMKLADDINTGRVAKPSIVLWPENASDIDPTTNADAAQAIQRAVDAVGVPIVVGTLIDGPGPKQVTNAGVVWMPSNAPHPGPGERYLKRHPVPFGEYIPLRSIARSVSTKVDLVTRDMFAGKGSGLLKPAGYPIGDVICFEIAYDSLVRSSVSAGAQMILVQTNNATFGHSSETYQQLAMSQLRAVEHARTVVQVSTSGESAIISQDGHIAQASGALFTADRLVQTVALSSSTTLATRYGAILEWLIVAVGLVGVAAGLRSAIRDRHLPSQKKVHKNAPASGASRVMSDRQEQTQGERGIG